MAREVDSETLEQIKLHAVHLLTPAQAQRTNLSFNRQVIERGELNSRRELSAQISEALRASFG